MIELGRRGFITGLAALVAAPAVIRVAPLMPISTRWTPRYVPASWLADDYLFQRYGMEPFALTVTDAVRLSEIKKLADLKKHAWPHPLANTWVDLNDYDPKFAREWAKRVDMEAEAAWQRHGMWWNDERV